MNTAQRTWKPSDGTSGGREGATERGERGSGAAASAASHRRWRNLGLAGLLLALPWCVLVLYAMQAALPSNPMVLPAQDDLLISARQVIPEGWSFFTRDPREADVFIFARHPAGAWKPAQVGSYAQPRFGFGWSRVARAQGLELGHLLAGVTGQDWQTCKDFDGCLAMAAEPIAMENPSPMPTLCGDLTLISAEPVPWAWARGMKRFHRPTSAVFLEARC